MTVGKYSRLIVALLAPLLLASCFLTPGKFTSEMKIDADGSFAFTYEGEIYMLGFQNLMKAGAEEEEEAFTGECFEDDGMTERDCSAEELEQQLAAKKAENAQMMAMFGGMFGGIDPASPEGVTEFVSRLEKQKGWDKIVHRGEGIFDIAYRIEGQLDRNFSFPELEKVQGVAPFVVAIVRKDRAIRIDAPGFAAEQNGSSLAMLSAIGGMGKVGKPADMGPVPVPNGVFRIVTNADILTNNTEDGPSAGGAGMQALTWAINQRTKAAPEALLKLD